MCEREGGSESETEEELEWKEHRDERRLERKESVKKSKKDRPPARIEPARAETSRSTGQHVNQLHHQGQLVSECTYRSRVQSVFLAFFLLPAACKTPSKRETKKRAA